MSSLLKPLKCLLSVTLCAALLTSSISFAGALEPKKANRFVTQSEINANYLNNTELSEEYPNGAVMFGENSGKMKMNSTYAVDVLRVGSAKGKASIKLRTVDLTAAYGTDYKLFLTNNTFDSGVKGSANLYYYKTGLPYIASPIARETYYSNEDDYDSKEQALIETSDMSNISAELMPSSSETLLEFEDGEKQKTVYIETYRKSEVSDDLEFMLAFSENNNCEISGDAISIFTISEERQKPETVLEVADAEVNPESDTAYISVFRSGNLGDFDSFKITTRSDTAVAGTDYQAYSEELVFMPNLEEIKVPVKLTSENSEGKSFKVEITGADEDVRVKKSVASVSFNSAAAAVSAGSSETLTYTSNMTFKSSKYVNYEFVDLSKFGSSTYKFGKSGTVNNTSYRNNRYNIDFYQKAYTCNGVSVKSNEKIDFTGVESIHFYADTNVKTGFWGGGTFLAALSLGRDFPVRNNDRDCNWMNNLGGFGYKWTMGRDKSESKSADFSINENYRNAENYLFLTVRNGAAWGGLKADFYNYTDDVNKSLRLNLKKYKIQMVDPEPVEVYSEKTGAAENVRVLNAVKISDPANPNQTAQTSVYCYRNNTMTISAEVQHGYEASSPKMEGIYLVKGNKKSELISLDANRSFTFSTSFIKKYSSFFDDELINNNKTGVKQVTIQPYFTYSGIDSSYNSKKNTPSFEVFSSNSAEDNYSIRADEGGSNEAVVYVSGKRTGVISWQKPHSTQPGYTDSCYHFGDGIKFNYVSDNPKTDKTKIAYERRQSNSSHSGLSKAPVDTLENNVIRLEARWTSITPIVSEKSITPQLNVTNSSHGSFTSKGTSYAISYENDKTVVTGYKVTKEVSGKAVTSEVLFSQLNVADRITLSAQPDPGYIAVWSYTDSADNKVITYYGNEFIYDIQNPSGSNQKIVNHLKLDFEYCDPAQSFSAVNVKLKGSLYMPKKTFGAGNVPSNVEPVNNAVIYMDGYMGITNQDGSFTLVDRDNAVLEQTVPVKVKFNFEAVDRFSTDLYTCYKVNYQYDEVHKALVYRDSSYFLCDVRLKGNASTYLYKLSTDSSKLNEFVSANLNSNRIVCAASIENRSASGIMPDRITYSSTTQIVTDSVTKSITLVNDDNVTFDLSYYTDGIEEDKSVNLIRWEFTDKKGVLTERSVETRPQNASSGILAAYNNVSQSMTLIEYAEAGGKMYVEFIYSDGAQEISYGRFDTGYSFVDANVDKSISYLPDIIAADNPDEYSESVGAGEFYSSDGVPLFGTIDLLAFRFNKFVPIISAKGGKTGTDEDGNDMYEISLGVSWDAVRSKAEDSNSFKDGFKNIKERMTAMSNALESFKGQFSGTPMSLKSSVSVSVSVTFTAQIKFVVADGSRHYLGFNLVFGATGAFHGSVPTVIIVVPCFMCMDVSAQITGYFSAVGQQKWVDSKNLSDHRYWNCSAGVNPISITVGGGVGLGFDGLLSVSGGVESTIVISDLRLDQSKCTATLDAWAKLQALFFNTKLKWNFGKFVVWDNSGGGAKPIETDGTGGIKKLVNRAAGKALKAASEKLESKTEDIYSEVTLDDLEIDQSETTSGGDPLSGHVEKINEVLAEPDTATVDPCVGKLSDTEYFIATITSDPKLGNTLKYYIYNTELKKVTESDRLIGSAVEDYTQNNEAQSEISLIENYGSLVDEVSVEDCGDKLFVYWNESTFDGGADSNIAEHLKSTRIVGIFYDKATREFSDFDVINSSSNAVCLRAKSVYNPDTGILQVFYEKADASGITDKTTIAELSDIPIGLETAYMDLNSGNVEFSAPQSVELNTNTISDYDIINYGSNTMLSYIGAESNSRIVENPIDNIYEIDSDVNMNDFGTENRMYLEQYSVADGEIKLESSLLISDEGFVTANPEFVKVDYNNCENTLLFFKCDGLYAYQDIENLYSHAANTDWLKTNRLPEPYMLPTFITDDEDHTVGDDFTVYSKDGSVIAMWTVAQAHEQQIWGREFTIDGIEYIDEVVVTDSNGNEITDSNGAVKTTKPESPLEILKGSWGAKTKVTEGGLCGSDSVGLYKQKFDAAILDSNRLLCVYNSYDELDDNSASGINNRFVIAEYDISPWYGVPEDAEPIEVSEYYPCANETVMVKANAVNSGFSTGRDVTLSLYSNGIKVDSVTYETWLADETKTAVFDYTMPEGINACDVKLYYTVSDNGGKTLFKSDELAFKSGSKLVISSADFEAVQSISENNQSARYAVELKIINAGNMPYSGGDAAELTTYDDVVAAKAFSDSQTDDPLYKSFGYAEISELDIGEGVTMSFISEEIPEEFYDKYTHGCIDLKAVITPKERIGWNEIKINDKYSFIDEMDLGMQLKPEDKNTSDIYNSGGTIVTNFTVEDISVPLADTAIIAPTVTPSTASNNAEFSFSSDNPSVASVNGAGLITALKQGSAIITVKCGDISKKVKVTVSKPVVGDINVDGVINIEDVTCLQKYLTGMIDFSDEQIRRADVNRNGSVTIADATYIQKYIAGIIATF